MSTPRIDVRVEWRGSVVPDKGLLVRGTWEIVDLSVEPVLRATATVDYGECKTCGGRAHETRDGHNVLVLPKETFGPMTLVEARKIQDEAVAAMYTLATATDGKADFDAAYHRYRIASAIIDGLTGVMP